MQSFAQKMNRDRALGRGWATVIGIFMITVLAGCTDRPLSRVDGKRDVEDRVEIPIEVNRAIDILFVIDNSDSMGQEQELLARNFELFMDKLEQIEGGLPDVHIGVVSTDLGAHPGIEACKREDGVERGDQGKLQVPDPASLPSATCPLGPGFLDGTFIRDVSTAEGGRARNYTGDLNTVFSCMAKLGIDGCGFEMPLEAMRQALTSGANTGFLREEALLAVIFITDEDDCSTEDYGMFALDQRTLADPLGPVTSFRCFEFGVVCEPDDPRTEGLKEACVPREDSPYMYGVSEYVEFLEGLKSNPRNVIVAGIIGDADSVEVITEVPAPTDPDAVFGPKRNLEPSPSCIATGGSSHARPAVRLDSFLRQFPDRNTITTICNDDLSGALIIIAELLHEVIGNPCLQASVDLAPEVEGVQYECQVSDVIYMDGYPVPGTDKPLPACTSATPDPAEYPCWHLEENAEVCQEPGQPFELVIERGDAAPPLGTHVVAHCVLR